MMRFTIHSWLLMAAFIFSTSLCSAQNNTVPEKQTVFASQQTPKPYRILTSGKQISIKSSKDINKVMLWTAGGHRVIEQKDINASTYSFTIPVTEKFFFLMIGLTDGKIYTEKIGVQ